MLPHEDTYDTCGSLRHPNITPGQLLSGLTRWYLSLPHTPLHWAHTPLHWRLETLKTGTLNCHLATLSPVTCSLTCYNLSAIMETILNIIMGPHVIQHQTEDLKHYCKLINHYWRLITTLKISKTTDWVVRLKRSKVEDWILNLIVLQLLYSVRCRPSLPKTCTGETCIWLTPGELARTFLVRQCWICWMVKDELRQALCLLI